MALIHSSSYGESQLRVLRVVRRGDRDDPQDLTIALRFDGDFAAAFREGDAAGLLPGEALKNLVYKVARQERFAAIETLGLALCDRILQQHSQVGRVRVEISQQPWARVDAGGKAQGQAFTPAGPERRTTTIVSNGTRASVSSGIEDLVLMRTSGLAPPRADADDFTADALQRLLLASLSVRWAYTDPDLAFAPYRQGIRQAVVETFACHARRSVQHTLYAIGDVILGSYPEISDVTLALQERPYRPADLLELSLDADALFVAHDEPVGTVEVTVTREPPS
ncbi:MAG: urate oxidase [Acidobacteria bacterium]|nr:urate oxidase [Acidobacteriota bacterium]